MNNYSTETYRINIDGSASDLKKYDTKLLGGVNYTFMGIVDTDIDEVPNVTCLYVNKKTGKLHRKVAKYHNVPKEGTKVINVEDIMSDEDKKLLNLTMHPDDDALMANMKSLLIGLGTTLGQFKRMYGPDRKTDMNNDKSRLETKHSLSWNKFVALLRLLNLRYRLDIY